ncbi:MAG: hypothetical protein RML35_09690 [Chloroherpetonaceae bacterium]|nr:hypothetical protein [Chloroherpetonaceae bacterium]
MLLDGAVIDAIDALSLLGRIGWLKSNFVWATTESPPIRRIALSGLKRQLWVIKGSSFVNARKE